MSAPKVVDVWVTGMTEQKVIPLDPTLIVRVRWADHGNARRGQAAVFGYGRYVIRYVSGRGNHSCQLIQRNQDGTERVLLETRKVKWCEICEQYLQGEG
jgi:hypothetical protein